jgi:hypothetical protein
MATRQDCSVETKLPLVSVVIPARDAALHVGRAIRSALSQVGVVTEVLVIDDGSSDGTGEVAASFPQGVRLISLARSLGPGGARNVGIRAARGAYIAFLDADDEWLPEKTACQVAVMERSPELTFVYCRAALVSDDPDAPKLVNEGREPSSGGDAWKALLAYPFTSTSTVLARRDAIDRAGLFDPDLPIAEDQDLWIRLARLGPIGYVENVLARVYDTPCSLMKRHGRQGVIHAWSVVQRHLHAAAADLTDTEVRRISAVRSAGLGRNAYEAGAIWLALRFLVRSVRLGHPVLPMVTYLLASSSPGRAAKAFLRAAFALFRCRQSHRAVKSPDSEL